jgi:hypothetical protein
MKRGMKGGMMTTVKTPSDFSDLLAAFEAEAVEYLVVGGYAVGAHARPHATKDLDLWVAGGANLERVARALERFGLPETFVEAARTLGEDEVLYFGAPPVRVDILRSLSGVSFAAARSRAEHFSFGTCEAIPFIGLDDLIANKRAAARPQDLADADALERIRSRRTP